MYAKSVKEILVMVATGQKMARGKNSLMSGFHFELGKI